MYLHLCSVYVRKSVHTVSVVGFILHVCLCESNLVTVLYQRLNGKWSAAVCVYAYVCSGHLLYTTYYIYSVHFHKCGVHVFNLNSKVRSGSPDRVATLFQLQLDAPIHLIIAAATS